MGCIQNQRLQEPEEVFTIGDGIFQQSKNSIINQTNDHKALMCNYNSLQLDSTTIVNSLQLIQVNEEEPISVKQIFSPQNTVKNILTDMIRPSHQEEAKEPKFFKKTKPQKQKRKRNRIDMNDLEKLF